MNYLSTILSAKAVTEMETKLSSEEINLLSSNLEFLDNYSDTSEYDEILSQWMDNQGLHYTLGDFIASYKDLQQDLEEANLNLIEPYQKVVQINNMLATLSDLDNMDLEEDLEIDSTIGTTIMPDIADVDTNVIWPGFDKENQSQQILVDKFGIEKAKQVYDGLFDMRSEASLNEVCTVITKQKHKMLSDLNESVKTRDYFKRTFTSVHKEWISSKK